MQSLKLVSGGEMPILGLGTWDLRGEGAKQAIKEALALGYTHIDTAWMYRNQREIGEALQAAKVDRSSLFITSKVWHTHLHFEGVLEQLEETIRDLHTPYVDLFLVHWPNRGVPMEETFGALQRIFEEGKARSIGVSNFEIDHLGEARSVSKIPISVNQIKYHPGAEQRDVLQWCQDHDVAVTAYSPLGKKGILKDSTLREIGRGREKTIAQVALRWLVQKGMVVIPKASSRAHLQENMDLFDWALSLGEMERIDGIRGGWVRRILS